MAGAILGSDQVMQGFIQLGLKKLQGQRLHNLLVGQFSLIFTWNISDVHVRSAARITKISSKRSPHHEKRMKAAVPGSTTITSPGKALLTPGAALGDMEKEPLYCPKLLHARLDDAGLVHPAGKRMLV